jgi:hypothetical protein
MDIFNPIVLEIVMLLCFGCSWPLAIAKTIRTQSVDGLSIWYISLVFIGYLAGILYKLFAHFDGVVWMYITNASMIFTEMILYFKYRRGNACRFFQTGVWVHRVARRSNFIQKEVCMAGREDP